MLDGDILRLVDAIRRSHSDVKPGSDYIWSAPPPIKVIDCVLSLNRRYDAFALPRVLAFVKRFPEVQRFDDLRRLIDACTTPSAFMEDALAYRHPARAETLSGVLDYAMRTEHRFDGATDGERMHQWAASAVPSDFTKVGVKGFGLAGFQYLRMLFGAETTKPDVHVINYVSDIVGRKLRDVDALGLLERAAAEAGLPLRWLDVAIWESRARPDQGGGKACFTRGRG